MKGYKLFFPFLIILVGLSACKKNEQIEESIESAQDNAMAENEFNSIFEFTESEAPSTEEISGAKISKLNRSGKLPDCATRVYNPESKTLTIEFEDEIEGLGCLCKDGNYRLGTITSVYEGEFHEVGSKATVTLSDYSFNGHDVTGSKSVEVMGSEDGNFIYNMQVRDASITTEDGTLSWEGDYAITRIEGNETLFNPFDDVYSVTGGASGVNRRGVNYTVNITTPLKRVLTADCLFQNRGVFVSGVFEVQNENGQKLVLDYDPVGGEPCDKLAQVTVGDFTRQITLRQ